MFDIATTTTRALVSFSVQKVVKYSLVKTGSPKLSWTQTLLHCNPWPRFFVVGWSASMAAVWTCEYPSWNVSHFTNQKHAILSLLKSKCLIIHQSLLIHDQPPSLFRLHNRTVRSESQAQNAQKPYACFWGILGSYSTLTLQILFRINDLRLPSELCWWWFTPPITVKGVASLQEVGNTRHWFANNSVHVYISAQADQF